MLVSFLCIDKQFDLPSTSGVMDDNERNETALPVQNKDKQSSFPTELDVGTQPKATQMREIVAKKHGNLFDLPE